VEKIKRINMYKRLFRRLFRKKVNYEERKKQLINDTVKTKARGNVSLLLGNFLTDSDIKKEKLAVLNHKL
jgi:hypothetical protein